MAQEESPATAINETDGAAPPNILFIMADEMRFPSVFLDNRELSFGADF